jgi:hypothetical protein
MVPMVVALSVLQGQSWQQRRCGTGIRSVDLTVLDALIVVGSMQYRCEATSVEGFVQQVAVQYLRHGYWFYVAGSVPASKDAGAVDRKLIARYGIAVSSKERTRRKRPGWRTCTTFVMIGSFC